MSTELKDSAAKVRLSSVSRALRIEILLDRDDAILAENLMRMIAHRLKGKTADRWVISLDEQTRFWSWFDDFD